MKIQRRSFLGLIGAATGGVIFGWYQLSQPYANPLLHSLHEDEFTFNPWLKISVEGMITIITPRAEMGQGIHTTLATLVAEELDVNFDDVQVDHGVPAPAYFNAKLMEEGIPFAHFDETLLAEVSRHVSLAAGKLLGLQITGGSTSTVDAYEKMRKAGAAARITLVKAASKRWKVDPGRLTTAGGRVNDPQTGRSFGYGDLAEAATELSPPADPPLRPSSDWRLLGKNIPRLDLRDKVTGAPVFASDLELPGMLHATPVMAPCFGGYPISVDDAETQSIQGVLKTVPVNAAVGKGFLVVADNTWSAFRGAKALIVDWSENTYPEDNAAIQRTFALAFNGDPATTFTDKGDVEVALESAGGTELFTADYTVPFLAHVTMEPMTATAILKDGRLDIWLGSQAPDLVQSLVASELGLEPESVHVHNMLMGGGFGRRGEIDYAIYAAKAAEAVDGRPVKVTWTREEDVRHDMYRPAAKAQVRALVPQNGGLPSLDISVAVSSITKSILNRYYPEFPHFSMDRTMSDGLFNAPLALANYRTRAYEANTGVPVGFWRSVGFSQNVFFLETALDEMAHSAGVNPLVYRLNLMGDDPEFEPGRELLKKLGQIAGSIGPQGNGIGRGIATTFCFGSWSGAVIEVHVRDEEITIDRCWLVADPGKLLNPRLFEDQLMGAAIDGLSASMMGAITFSNGAVKQRNFYDYPIIAMSQLPEFEFHVLENSKSLGGAGEIGTPPIAPALGNAIFAATGRRLRDLPFSQSVEFAG